MVMDKIGFGIHGYKSIFEALPGNSVLLTADGPQFTILAASNGLLQLTGKTREELYNQPLFGVFPANPSIENIAGQQDILASFNYVIANKDTHHFTSTRYDITDGEGRYVEK